MALPIPRPPPVTMAVLPINVNGACGDTACLLSWLRILLNEAQSSTGLLSKAHGRAVCIESGNDLNSIQNGMLMMHN